MSHVLVLNTGSSSIRYRLFDTGELAVLASGLLEGIGEEAGGSLTRGKMMIQSSSMDTLRTTARGSAGS
jgi:acetate kinase